MILTGFTVNFGIFFVEVGGHLKIVAKKWLAKKKQSTMETVSIRPQVTSPADFLEVRDVSAELDEDHAVD